MQFSKLVVLLCCVFATPAFSQGGEDGQRLNIRVYLEGALLNNGFATGPDGRPLMRDNLRISPFDNLSHLPTSDPYQTHIGDVDLARVNAHVGVGNRQDLTNIQDPDVVFGITGENAIVDWVFVEIRSAENYARVIATRSGLLQRDGDVVDLDGTSSLWFPDLTAETFRVVVRHRNHIGAMSDIVTAERLVDFTSPSFAIFDYGTSYMPTLNFSNLATKMNALNGYRALWSGDFNSDCKIKCAIPNDDLSTAFYEQDFTGTGYAPGYYQGDFDMNSIVTFTGSPSDAQLLESQVKNFNLNPSRIPNFNYFIEQVPPRN